MTTTTTTTVDYASLMASLDPRSSHGTCGEALYIDGKLRADARGYSLPLAPADRDRLVRIYRALTCGHAVLAWALAAGGAHTQAEHARMIGGAA